jgi:hypothetical protein
VDISIGYHLPRRKQNYKTNEAKVEKLQQRKDAIKSVNEGCSKAINVSATNAASSAALAREQLICRGKQRQHKILSTMNNSRHSSD